MLARRHSPGRQLGWLLRQLATLLQAGVPLSMALETLAQGPMSANMHKALRGLRGALADGEALSRAMQRFPAMFPARVCTAIQAAEAGGQLAETLTRLAAEQESRQRLAAKVRQVMFYPALVLLTGLGVMLGVCLTVVPVFRDHYTSAGRALPLATRGLLHLTDLIMSPLAWGSLSVLVLLLLWLRWRQGTVPGARRLSRLLSRLPLWGPLRHEVALARWSQTLALLLEAGVPLLDALPAAAQAADHPVLDPLTRTLVQQIHAGSSLQQALSSSGWFPPLLLQLVRVGEQSGSLAGLCGQAATYYAAEAEQRVLLLTGLLEPLSMLLLGLMCAGLIWALYLPVFDLGETVM